MTAARWRVIGQALPRKEDARLVTGRGRFLDDIEIPRALHAMFLRSPHGHARIRGIDTNKARAMPGVVVIWTGADFAGRVQPLRMAPAIDGLKPTLVPPFPVDFVRFVGDLVACVVAETREAAQDALEAIAVDYDMLSAVTSIDGARATAAPRVDPALDSNHISHQSFRTPDIAASFARADRIVTARFSQHRQTHMPLEPRGIIASWDAGRRHLEVTLGSQAVHPFRSSLAARLALAESQITVVSPDVGGGFGQKIAVFREDAAVAALSIALERPVRWREERGENFLASLHAREESAVIRAAVARDGRILALEAKLLADMGAYCFFPANYMARVIAMILPGPYRIRDYAYEVDVFVTNKCPAGPMRAPMSSASWFIEGTIDAIARELSLDPIAVRRANVIGRDELPYVTATGEAYTDISPRETLDAALMQLDLAMFRATQNRRRARGERVGLGLCNVVESTTYGSDFYKKAGIPGSGHEVAVMRIEPSGAVLAAVGLMASGQGYETTFAQCAAEGLGVRAADVAIRIGHSDIAPYGMGSRGARGASAGGGVLYLAGRRMREKVLRIAAHRLGLNAADGLDLVAGRVMRLVDGDWREAPLTLADIARTAHLDPLNLPPGTEPGLHVSAAYDPPPMTYSNATHACIVAIDEETGRLRIERYIVAHDSGTQINPTIVHGQLHGAIAMGLSGVLGEHCRYGDDGQMLAASLMDYPLAMARDLPMIEIVDVDHPSPHTPCGTKGMSEGGVMGAIGALCNAVSDALGVAVEAQPLTAENVRRLIVARR